MFIHPSSTHTHTSRGEKKEAGEVEIVGEEKRRKRLM